MGDGVAVLAARSEDGSECGDFRVARFLQSVLHKSSAHRVSVKRG